LDPDAQIMLASELQSDREGQHAAVELITLALGGEIRPQRTGEALSSLGLCLIGLGRFEEALEALAQVPNFDRSVAAMFNYAMARWGASGDPDLGLFRLVSAIQSRESDMGGANYSQCLALVHGVLGDRSRAIHYVDEATERIRRTPHREFSCWRYLSVAAPEFEQDLTAITRVISGERILPAFVEPQRSFLPTA
jgi:tetratricopeptide (TPR) repeat protein